MSTPIIPTSDSTDNLNQCAKCRELKPREAFNRSSTRSSGLQAWCRDCYKQYSIQKKDVLREKRRQYRLANVDRLRERDRAYNAVHRETILARHREYYAENVDRFHDYYVANAPKKREYNRRYYADNKHRLASHRRDLNRKYRVLKREYLSEQNRIYRTTNADLIRARNHRRYARLRGLEDTLTAQDWRAALQYFDGHCAVCGRPPGLWHTLSADHWVPLTSPDCPGTVPWNIVPLCHGVDGCNNSKGNRNAREWLVEKFGKRKGRAIQNRIEDYLTSRKPALTESA